MHQRWAGYSGVLAVALLSLAAPPAQAVIMRLTPLREVLRGEQFIFQAKVASLDPARPAVVLEITDDFKGKAPFRRLPMSLTGDSEGQREGHPAKLLRRLAPGLPLLGFTSTRGKRSTAFFYTNGTWFQAIGQAGDDGAVRWSFTHCEPYLRRTFKGTTEALRQVIVDGLAGKAEPPEPDPKEPPGLGPEVPTNPGGQSRHAAPGTPPLFAVIPTFVLVGPMALLAALFPAVFGGLALSLRRWLVLLSVASLASTLFLLHSWFRQELKASWWGRPSALWLGLAVLTLAGAAWSLVRQRAAWRAGRADALAPRPSDEVVLWLVALVGVGTVLYGLAAGTLAQPPWRDLLPAWAVAWVGVLYLLGIRLSGAADRPRRALRAESVMLAGLGLACTGMAVTLGPPPPGVAVAWMFEAAERGVLFSSPLVAGDRVYAGAAHSAGLTPFGTLYCLDRATGKEVWQFDDDGGLKQVFSSPCLADGRLYVGEGFHQDADCKLYCLDAATGRKLWDFTTTSHTESSPCVVAGRVFFGAGDAGVYCLDAATGKEVWHFPGLHVDTSPLVLGTRLYGGSGYGQHEVFCLDTETGRPLWRLPVELPAFGQPAAEGDRIFFGLGNGDFLKSAEEPAGALLCVDAATGRRLWRRNLPDAVHVRPVVHEGRIWFGARDGQVYCLECEEGRLLWQRELGSPIVASPALAGSRLYVAASAGQVVSLNARTGEPGWVFDVGRQTQTKPQLFASPTAYPEGEHWRVYVGAGLGTVVSSSAAVVCLEDKDAIVP